MHRLFIFLLGCVMVHANFNCSCNCCASGINCQPVYTGSFDVSDCTLCFNNMCSMQSFGYNCPQSTASVTRGYSLATCAAYPSTVPQTTAAATTTTVQICACGQSKTSCAGNECYTYPTGVCTPYYSVCVGTTDRFVRITGSETAWTR